MGDRYTVRRADDGSVRIFDGSQPHTQSPFTPRDPFDELVIKAIVDELNCREFRIAGTAREIAERLGMPVEALQLHIKIQSYRLYLRMRQEQGAEGDRPWRP